MKINLGDLVEYSWADYNRHRGIVLANGRTWYCASGCFEIRPDNIVDKKRIHRVIKRNALPRELIRYLR